MSYDQIDPLIDMGLGFAANELGVPHDVYRLNASSNGNLFDSANKIATVKVFTKVAYGAGVRDSFDSEKVHGIMFYRIIGDMRSFLIGDCFRVNDPIYGLGIESVNFATQQYKGFALADRAPIKKRLGGRLNTTITIERNAQSTNSEGQWDQSYSGAQPVILLNGVYSIGNVGDSGSKIPAGLIASGKSYGGTEFSKIPGVPRKSGWNLYMPVLNGFDVREGDTVYDEKGARYTVVVPYVQDVGATGEQWFLEREVAGT